MIFLCADDLSENQSATADICSRIRVSTRVGGYMRGGGRGRNIRARSDKQAAGAGLGRWHLAGCSTGHHAVGILGAILCGLL